MTALFGKALSVAEDLACQADSCYGVRVLRQLISCWVLVVVLTACGDDAAPVDSARVDGAVVNEVCAQGVCVPTEVNALNAWLREGGYSDWPRESAIHPSAGPHSQVRTSIHPALNESLQSESASHPKGAAAVKELYDGTTLSGWVVSVKIADDSDKGKGWYWYEVFSTAEGAKPAVAGVGSSSCAPCHTAGKDYVLSPFPLQ